jgi:hypothetical protein
VYLLCSMYIKGVLSYDFVNLTLSKVIFLLGEANFDFIDQLNPKANLGCHPYHVTIIGNINGCFPDANKIDSYLSRWSRDLDYVKFKLVNKIRISNRGLIKLFVKSSSLKEVAHEIFETLKTKSTRVRPFYNEEYFHITLGVTRDPRWFGKDISIDVTNESFTFDKFSWDY